MQVLIPTPLQSYTGAAQVEAEGTTLDALLDDLDRRYPGMRFRLVDEQGRTRAHMRIFVNGKSVFDLTRVLEAHDEVAIVQALSGG
ncbi:MoaD/ThiS family protein [Pseudazoarcus pumilus]|uniref:Molybdopterin synthase sulfur carrier subunit n=1 Tax=Pseudazoarcus pumilus TaxID=2067960 RepID=A0A2I6S9R6_9RHOO|nr:MoaD/ThiS family protein [Pseudazoarcus pumilus]AUN96003.1 molybdopterin synthase sulfur carrier subunit [Pseudazoarcus pumilus]